MAMLDCSSLPDGHGDDCDSEPDEVVILRRGGRARARSWGEKPATNSPPLAVDSPKAAKPGRQASPRAQDAKFQAAKVSAGRPSSKSQSIPKGFSSQAQGKNLTSYAAALSDSLGEDPQLETWVQQQHQQQRQQQQQQQRQQHQQHQQQYQQQQVAGDSWTAGAAHQEGPYTSTASQQPAWQLSSWDPQQPLSASAPTWQPAAAFPLQLQLHVPFLPPEQLLLHHLQQHQMHQMQLRQLHMQAFPTLLSNLMPHGPASYPEPSSHQQFFSQESSKQQQQYESSHQEQFHQEHHYYSQPKAGSSAGARTTPKAASASRREPSQGRRHEQHSMPAGAEGQAEPCWLADASDVDQVLDTACAALDQLNATDIISSLHMVAKFSEAEAFGSVRGLQSLVTDARFTSLVARLRLRAAEIESPRNFMRIIWAFGKVGARGQDVEAIITHTSVAAPLLLQQFSSQELSNVLWGLARLSSEGGVHARHNQSSTRLAFAVISASTLRVAVFSAQCLTNSLWAVAKLDLRGPEVETFSHACVEALQSTMFNEMSPQGLANSLWAVAKLRLNQEVAVRFCLDAARRATASDDLLKLFFPQELSMALWAAAKLVGRGPARQKGGRGQCYPEVEKFALAVADEACERIQDFSPQGLSNISWALATLNLSRHEASRKFFVAAALTAAPLLHSYPPQAIANLCWAFGRAEGLGQVLGSFGAAAALEAQRRAKDFSWQDLSGIVSALLYVGLNGVSEVQDFAYSLVVQASSCCAQIGTQALLNIALSAVRLGVDTQAEPLQLPNNNNNTYNNSNNNSNSKNNLYTRHLRRSRLIVVVVAVAAVAAVVAAVVSVVVVVVVVVLLLLLLIVVVVVVVVIVGVGVVNFSNWQRRRVN
ncbi:unnamed protein product [Polarella glacialis]|uniref:Uncharacterized protein n=1 Tax=Polarella glacialis TaxID=89957 RepID=A0A813K0X7_POLGL|nr:unnamed protein product [Polarella glacialis]